jgi:N-acetylmuramoyl-L-alanine amidase
LAPALAVVLFGSSLSARPASYPLNQVHIGGKDYLRASQWAASKGLTTRWLPHEEALQLTKNSSTLILKADCREARINGVQVWLSYPVAQNGGNLYVSRLDCETTLEPILFPSRMVPGSPVRTICLDPGHGGKDPGNQVGSNQEKRYTLLLAEEVRDELVRAGFKVTLTRTRDNFVELGSRSELARHRNADLFVSLHFNSSDSSRSTVHGSEVYCLAPPGAKSTNAQGEGGGAEWCLGHRHGAQNLLLAYEVQKSLTQRLAVEDRGVRRARFAVLREATMPAVLIEAGFMSHPAEGRKIFTTEYRQQIARAIANGIVDYKRAVGGNGSSS